MLNDDAAGLLADALQSLPPRDPAEKKAEVLEILRVPFSLAARTKLEEAAARSGVDVLLSKPDGPALRVPRY